MKGKRKSLDRISALPQDTIEKILSHMPIRDALRTSILSRKWRYCWASMPKLAFQDRLIVSSDNKDLDRHKFVKAILHVLLLRRAPILELSLFVDIETCSEVDQIILHLSISNNIKKFIFGVSGMLISRYLLPCSMFSLQGLEQLSLLYCKFNLPLMNKGFGMLKSLCLAKVYISNEMLFKLLTNCPLLEKFTWLIGSDTVLTECEWAELFKCLPSVQVLEIFYLDIERLAAGGIPHKLPSSLPNLRTLVLNVCFLELSTVLCVISSSPNLEMIKVDVCWDCCYVEPGAEHTFQNLVDEEDYTGLKLVHLKEVEITSFRDSDSWMEFLKLIMAKSPVLNKARIQLCNSVSVDEEVKMLRGMLHMQFPRASPAASFIIQRPKC